MHRFAIFFTALMVLASPVRAQVAVDLNALDPAPSPTKRPEPRPRPRPSAQPSDQPLAEPLDPTTARPAPRPSAAPRPAPKPAPSAAVKPTPEPPAAATPAPSAAAAVALPTTPPPPAAASPAPPEPPHVTANATAALRLTFGGEETELTPDRIADLKRFVGSATTAGAAGYNVFAYAGGPADDASIARRLSLSRALAVRGALMEGGVPSSRIYMRALGAQSGDGPPDRVDLTALSAAAR